MKVMLARSLYLGNQRYRRDPGGTELPDHIDMVNSKGDLVSMEVVLDRDGVNPETQIALPKGTTLFDEAKAVKPVKDKPMALSKMPLPKDPVRPHAPTPKLDAFKMKDKPNIEDDDA